MKYANGDVYQSTKENGKVTKRME